MSKQRVAQAALDGIHAREQRLYHRAAAIKETCPTCNRSHIREDTPEYRAWSKAAREKMIAIVAALHAGTIGMRTATDIYGLEAEYLRGQVELLRLTEERQRSERRAAEVAQTP